MNKNIKKLALFWLSLSVVLLSVVITGCIEYKTAPDSADGDLIKEDDELVKEIAAIGQELDNAVETSSAKAKPEEAVGEVILPELESTAGSSGSESANELNSDKRTLPEQVITVKENQKLSLRPKVIDPDQEKVKVTYSLPVNELGEWKTTYGDSGEYLITVTATDGATTASRKLKVIVEKDNVAPILDNLQDITIREGETVKFNPMVNDLNGDKVTVTVSEPLQDNLFKTDFSSAGTYPITVTASDGQLQTTKSFILTINNVNQKPIIKNEEKIVASEGETLRLTPAVEDPDGDPVMITISEPVGDDGLWDIGYTDHGEYAVTITAADGTDTVSQKISVVIVDVNAPVEFIDIVVDIN